ncbi:GTP cyclohydrolase 1-like [Phragmites australis]|uniref:GTP cyclohydrolase 1-like n=1 Tax=Phragmites australis TaxID=29695 RepID=UPI002D769217|nr:GTP cyclohydrolase 1-like [Phragmites australis]XP_062227018.1 GTP cyclohydrolase 1-like [Phragmites australis]
MGALEEPHLAAALAAACACEEDDGLELLGGDGEAAAAGDAMEPAVRALLVGLGEDERREGLRRTPKRVAKAFRDGTRGYQKKVKDIVQGALFPEVGVNKRTGSAGGTGGQVVVRDIELFSYCESCLLPFSIQCHVGYVPSGGRVVGLSKLSRVADVFAKRLQNPQRLANEVCGALHASIQPAGVAVALHCWHIPLPENLECKTLQGWIRTSHSSRSGVFEVENNSFWHDFLALLKLRGIDMEMDNHSVSHSWCPLGSHEVLLFNGHCKKGTANGAVSPKSAPSPSNMVSAVSSMLLSLGEDPHRKELLGTPQRYVQWLMKFRACNLEVKLTGFTLNSAIVYGRPGGDAADRRAIHSELHLPFCSQCEHHLLPFYGVVHIGYFDNGSGEGIDRSHFQALVHFYGCKLQVQERMTRQIAEAVYSVSHSGAMVVVEANHICMISRGIEKIRSSTATIAVLGQFLTNPSAKACFLQNVLDTAGSVV